jgi:hypothetical protein
MSGIRPRFGRKITSKPLLASSALLTLSAGISLSINVLRATLISEYGYAGMNAPPAVPTDAPGSAPQVRTQSLSGFTLRPCALMQSNSSNTAVIESP